MIQRDAMYEKANVAIKSAAVTDNYPSNRDSIIQVLNDALATEIVCVLRYRRHYYMASGIRAEIVADEFLAHSNQELSHADKLAQRIAQLGGSPDFNPLTLDDRSHARYHSGTDLAEMIHENLLAERVAVENYRELIRAIGNTDPVTRCMLETILADEEEHAEDMSALLSTSSS